MSAVLYEEICTRKPAPLPWCAPSPSSSVFFPYHIMCFTYFSKTPSIKSEFSKWIQICPYRCFQTKHWEKPLLYPLTWMVVSAQFTKEFSSLTLSYRFRHIYRHLKTLSWALHLWNIHGFVKFQFSLVCLWFQHFWRTTKREVHTLQFHY